MQFDAKTVWLMSCNKIETFPDKTRKVEPEVIHRVVIAADVADAYHALELQEASLVAIGHANLAEFETIAEKIRSSLDLGANDGTGKLVVLRSYAMSELQ